MDGLKLTERIYILILRSEKTQKTVAQEIGMSPERFNRILKGERVLSADYIIPLCNSLGCTPNTLFGFPEEPGNTIAAPQQEPQERQIKIDAIRYGIQDGLSHPISHAIAALLA